MVKTLLYILFLSSFTSAYAEIYKWTDENGNVIFSDKNTNVNSEVITIKEPNSIKAKNKPEPKQGDSDIEYALNIRKLNSEYGTNIPKELCADKHKNPCKMPINLLLQPVNNINETKHNLTNSAWNALKKRSGTGKATASKGTWEFNLCREKWKKNKYCVPVNGYIVIKDNIVEFYTFFIKGISSRPDNLNRKEFTSIKPDSNKNQTRILSWEVTEQNEDHIVISVKYFYDGEFKEVPIWLSASTLNNGNRSRNDEVWPSKIVKGEGIVNIKLKASSRAPNKYCTNQIMFSIYGKDISTFHRATVDFNKCWVNNINPTESHPIKGIN